MRHHAKSLQVTQNKPRVQDVAQVVECPPVNIFITLSILLSGPICSLGYFPLQLVVHNWSIKGCGMSCSVCGKVHIKTPLLFIGKSHLCGDSRVLPKKYVRINICLTSNSRSYENQCALEVSLYKTNFTFRHFKTCSKLGLLNSEANIMLIGFVTCTTK